MGRKKKVGNKGKKALNKTIGNHQKATGKGRQNQKQLSFFYEILVLIVSLLHGTLFFSLAEKTIDLINSFTLIGLSYLTFFFAIFLRIFQTHILAAIKYTEKWDFKPLDFILVFSTALFEYVLVSNDRIQSHSNRWYFLLIISFCLFGIIGYSITYRRTRNAYTGKTLVNELRIQGINIICILIVGLLHASYFFGLCANMAYINFISAFMLIINTFFSLFLSKNELEFFFHIS